MAEGKWIDGLKATTPLDVAARKVLGVRLRAVRQRIPAALRHAGEDPEHVHQLRVATRRARAAIDLFEECLPGKVYRKLRQSLRSIRRGAGPARDWDVFLQELEENFESASAPRKPGIVFLMGHCAALRSQAQAGLREQIEPIDLAAIEQHAVAAIRAKGTDTLGGLATSCLTGLLRELHTGAARSLNQHEHLHELRIIGKRLRYAMELFVGCYGPAFRTNFYPAIEEMQDILGRANDSHVASQRLVDIRNEIQATRLTLWKKVRAGIEFLHRLHERRLARERKNFERWWKRWRKTGAEEAFAELLVGTSDSPPVKTQVPAAEPVAVESVHPEVPDPAQAGSSPETESAAIPHSEAPLVQTPEAQSTGPSKPAVG